MFREHLKRMCILLFLEEVFYKSIRSNWLKQAKSSKYFTDFLSTCYHNYCDRIIEIFDYNRRFGCSIISSISYCIVGFEALLLGSVHI